MRDDRERILDMLDAIGKIEQYTGKGQEGWVGIFQIKERVSKILPS